MEAAQELLSPAVLSPLRWHLVPVLSALDAARLACTCRVGEMRDVQGLYGLLQSPSGRYLAQCEYGIDVVSCSSDLAAVASLPLLQSAPRPEWASMYRHVRWSGDCLWVLTRTSAGPLALVEWEPSRQNFVPVSRSPFSVGREAIDFWQSSLCCQGSYLSYFVCKAEPDQHVLHVDKLLPTWDSVFTLDVVRTPTCTRLCAMAQHKTWLTCSVQSGGSA